jgi:hypothetical protein
MGEAVILIIDHSLNLIFSRHERIDYDNGMFADFF